MSQSTTSVDRTTSSQSRGWLLAGGLLIIGIAVAMTYQMWLPAVQSKFATWNALATTSPADHGKADSHADDGHAGHDHAGHDESHSIELSPQARKNIGLKEGKVALTTFTNSVTVPGIVVERPGQSVLEVTAPLTGIVKEIFAIQGEVVEPGQKLFELRLTHEEVVQAQAEMLRTVEELAVNHLEIERLTKLAASGGVAGKTLLEREYEKQKQLAVLRAQRQTLLLHGLSQEQVDQIELQKTLLQTLTIFAPTAKLISNETPKILQLESLKVSPGQHVNAGDTLAQLTDHSELFIEGNAFERDADEINRAAAEGLPITAYIESDDKQPLAIENLELLYVAGQVNVDTRTLHFYVLLPNEKLRERNAKDRHRFVTWRYRPGQRMQLQVPVEQWKDRIVLPVEAIAQEGPETYAFAANGDHFDRRPVHVEYRDARNVVIANDGSIFPGDTLALSSAQQLHLAIKNKSGGAIDPHAGHNH